MERAQRQSIRLTDRQREVLRLIERGHTNSEIAGMLGISLQGAKWHVRELLGKFGVDSREELAEAWARSQSGPQRVRSWLSGLAALVPAKAAVGGIAGGAVLTASAAVMVAGSTGPGEDKVPAETIESTPTPVWTPIPAPTPLPDAPGAVWSPEQAYRQAFDVADWALSEAVAPSRFAVPFILESRDYVTGSWNPSVARFDSADGDSYWLPGSGTTPDIWAFTWHRPGVALSDGSPATVEIEILVEDGNSAQRWAAARVAIRTSAGQTIAGRSDFRSKAITDAIREAVEPTGPTVRVAWLNGHAGGESLGIYPTSTGRWCAVHLEDDEGGSLRACYLSPERPGGGPVGLNGGLGTMAGPGGSRNVVQIAAEEPITRIEVRYPDGQAVLIDLSPAPPETGLPWAFAYFTVERVSEGFTVVGLDAAGNELARFEQTPPGIAPPLPTGP